jgi:hypothetical protein
VTAARSVTVFSLDESELRQKYAQFIEIDPKKTCRPFEDACIINEQLESRRKLQINTTAGPTSFLPHTLSISDEPTSQRQLQAANEPYGGTYLTKPPRTLTFKMPAFMLAKFAFDLRHIPQTMTYDDHYRIAIFVDGHKHISPYPASFWFDPPTGGVRPLYPAYAEYRWSKSTRFSLLLHSMQWLWFRVELQILHGLYTDQVDLFVGTLELHILPEAGVFRSDPGEVDDGAGADTLQLFTFVTALERGGKFAMPLNMPRVLPMAAHYPGLLAPHQKDNIGAILEYARRNMSSGILLDPLEGDYNTMYTSDDYWSSSLTVVPMQFLPYFSQCTGGVRIGFAPSGAQGSHNYQLDATSPFRLGHEDAQGGAPVRRRGTRVKCNCNGVFTYEDVCGGNEGREGCIVVPDENSIALGVEEPLREIFMTVQAFPNLEPGSTEQRFLSTMSNAFGSEPDFLISNQCLSCEASGYTIGGPYPALASDPATEQVQRIDGWDSRVPIFFALEHPEACNLVPDGEIVAIGEWDVFSTARYSDACDYVMQCMYEENSLLAPGKQYWFDQVLGDDIMFWISFRPMSVDDITIGFCFPDIEGGTDDALKAQRMAECEKPKKRDYFNQLKEDFKDEAYMFVQADTATQDANVPGWFPLRFQLSVEYWQRRECSNGVCELKKELVKARLLQPTSIGRHQPFAAMNTTCVSPSYR